MASGIAIRVAAVQTALVATISIALALALPRSFFEDWGWLSGPGAWIACAALTALILSLSVPRTLIGAALCGLPSLVAVLVGVHWLGALIAIVLLAVWCGFDPLARSGGAASQSPSTA